MIFYVHILTNEGVESLKVSKKVLYDWLFPIIVMVMFGTLLAAILAPMDALPLSQLIAFSVSPLAYSLMLVGMFIASRPRKIERHLGMPRMYEIHAIMTVYAFILVFIHVLILGQGFSAMFRNPATIFGYLGFLGILSGMLSGTLSLSGIFIGKNKTFLNIKENVLNREVMLWVHRIGALMAIIGTYLQILYIPFLRNNTPYIVLVTIYTVAVLGYFVYWKLKIATSPKFKVKSIYKGTPALWVLEFEPVKGKISPYIPGDYFFIRFKGDADITKEAHPFSTSSAITKRFSNSIEFMIKEAGDWTDSLANIKEGDIATLEGPYGDFLPKAVEVSDEEVPFILLGGGIGLTPCLSVLRHEVEKGSQREIHLIWGLAYEEDMFMLDEFREIEKQNPNFHLHIIFSNEKVEGYPFGFISSEFLAEVGADKYKNGEFFVCGPPPMLNASRKILADGNVPEKQIHLDDFGF